MTLATFQDQVWRALWAPPGEPDGMDDGRRAPLAAPALPLTSQPGFAVYRNTVLTGCVDALVSLYPAVHRLVGDDWLRAAALDYARAMPPASGELQRYGDGFPDFLARVLARHDRGGDWPWLADVARLDRDWSESHVAADAPALDLPTLLRQDPDQLSTLHLSPHPAARWRRSADWPAFSLWHAARSAAADPNPARWSPQAALMTRPHGAVLASEISLAACALLDACASGTALGEALDAVQARFAEADVGAELAFLLQQGAFARPSACLTESSP